MVSTKSNTKGGGPRDKGSQQKAQNVKSPTIPVPAEPPAGKKATAEQIRLANMIYSDSTEMDNDKIKEQVQQIKELTNRTEDEILVVLYDANYDTEQAINMLLERDETENKSIDGWVTTSSKKSKLRNQQGGSGKAQLDSPDLDISARGSKPDRERGRGGRDRDKNNDSESRDRGQDPDRRRDREGGYRGKGRGGRGPLPPRMARGKGREYDGGSRDRYRGDRDFGRGRGRRNGEMNGPARSSRGGGARSFTNSSFTDNSKPVENDAFNSGDNVWRNPPEENWDDVEQSARKEDWGAEEWTGDLTHSQVFTASAADEVGANSIDAAPPTSEPPLTTSPAAPYAPGRSSQEGSATFGGSDTFQSTSIYTTSVSQQNTGMPEMTRSIDIAELFRNSTQHSASQSTLPVSSNKEDTSIFSQFQTYQTPPTIPSGEPPKPSSQMSAGTGQVQSSLSRAPQMPNSQPSQQPRTHHQPKPTRKKLPPGNSKFPPSAVEMPLSARGLGPLDVQFGAMDINIDPAITDYGIVIQGSSLSSKGDLSSGAFSVNDTKSSASHMSSYNAKVTDSAYSTGIGSSRMSNSIPSSVPASSMDQSVRAAYGHGQNVPSQKLAPDPIPLPTQSELKSSQYMGGQKTASNGPIESAVDSTTLSSSVGISTSVLPPSTGYGLPGGQGLSTSRQAGSYGTPSSAVTVSSSIPGYGNPAMSSGGLGTGLSSTGTSSLGGSMGAPSSMGPASTIGANPLGGSNSLVGSNSLGGVTSMGATSVINGAGTNSLGYSSSSNLSPLPSSNSSSYSVSSANASQSTHTSVQTSPLSNTKIGPMETRPSQHGLDSGPSSVNGSASVSTTSTSSISAIATTLSSASTSSTPLGFPSTTNIGSALSTSMSVSGSISSSGIKPSNKVPPNLPPGMPFVNHHLIMGGHGLLPVNAYAHQFYNFEDLMLQRMQQPMGYPYDLQQYQQLATTLNTGRDATPLSNTAQYSVTEASKFTRNDAASPVASSLSSQQQQQQQQQAAGGHHQTQAQTQTPFLNPTLPPGYPTAGYGGLPYGGLAYPGASILPPGLSYPVFPAVSTVQPPSRTQAGSTPHSVYQQSAFAQPATYGTNTAMKRVSGYQPFGHPGPQPNPPGAFGTLQGYDEAGDFTKGFSSQSQSKGSAQSARGAVSVSTASDVGGSYGSKSHSQTFADKQSAYHNQTPPPFNFPMATATQGGHAGATYPTPFVPLFPPQAHSAMPLHQIPGDTSGAGSSQRSQGSSGQNKGPSGKGNYGAYWGN
ncbi:uncharacterized protein [Apostichopus japonicus]|uniref:uncharacterized protein isoform X2 n=1 Tax=Stichopus japonicus TaxID=307972 RepID=UPI003AB17172